MMKASRIVLWVFSLSLIAVVYGFMVKPDLMTRIFIEQITSPAAIFTGIIFVVGTFGVIWKRIKLTKKLKGE